MNKEKGVVEHNFQAFRKAVRLAVLDATRKGDLDHRFEFEGQSYVTSFAIDTINFLIGWYKRWDDEGNPRGRIAKVKKEVKVKEVKVKEVKEGKVKGKVKQKKHKKKKGD